MIRNSSVMVEIPPPQTKEASPNAESLHTRIQPSHGWASLGLRELWEYRELLFS